MSCSLRIPSLFHRRSFVQCHRASEMPFLFHCLSMDDTLSHTTPKVFHVSLRGVILGNTDLIIVAWT